MMQSIPMVEVTKV